MYLQLFSDFIRDPTSFVANDFRSIEQAVSKVAVPEVTKAASELDQIISFTKTILTSFPAICR